MNTMSVRVRYRPVRIGWCVEAGDWNQLRMALRLTHAFAGGRYNPVIPVQPEAEARKLVLAFRLDLLYPLIETGAVKAFADSYKHLLWPHHERTLFYPRWQHHPPHAAFVDVHHAAFHIHERRIRDVAQPVVQGTLFRWQSEDPLGDVLLATVGAYPQASHGIPDYERLLVSVLRGRSIDLALDDPMPADLNTALTPSRLTTYDLEAYGSPFGRPGVYVGHADDFASIVDYWNYRAASHEMFFFDPQYAERLREPLNVHLEWLRTLPERPDWERQRITAWVRDETQFDLSALGDSVLCRVHTPASVDPPIQQWPEQAVLGTVDESGKTPAVTFALPAKPVFDDIEFSSQDIGVSVSGFQSEYERRNLTFFPPFLPELNEYYGRELYFQYDRARAEPESLGLLLDLGTDDVTLRALPALQLISRICGMFGIDIAPSRAGQVTSRLIDQMGGIEHCDVFKIVGVRNLIGKYRADESFTRSHAHQTIGNADPTTGAMRFEQYEDLFIAPRPRERKLKPHDVFDFLLQKGVFRVGLDFTCPHCELSFWISLDDTRTRITCELCGTPFDVSTQLRDRCWAFRRSGVFGRDDHQSGGIPVALTLQQLTRTLSSSLSGVLYSASVDLTPRAAAIEPCESDFILLTTGHVDGQQPLQIVIAECKSGGGKIDVHDAEKLAKVAEAFRDPRIKVYIVFAKTGAFSAEEVLACASAQGEWHQRVILLSADELEPWDVYDRHADAKERRLADHNLETLASSTVVLYPQLRPRGFATLDHGRVDAR